MATATGFSSPPSYIHYFAPDVLLPDEWYSHEIQSALFRSGLRVPVYADALARRLGLPEGSIPCDAHGVCNIPGTGDDLVAELWRGSGSPIHDRYSKERLVALVTPPLCVFDNTHLLGSKVHLSDEDGLPERVEYIGRAPYNLVEQACALVSMAFATYASRRGDTMDADTRIVGARLNMLSSGLRNIVMFVHIGCSPKPDRQTFLDVSPDHVGAYVAPRAFSQGPKAGRLRVRLIPGPLEYVNGFFGDLGRLIHVKVDRVEEQAYDRAFDAVQTLLRQRVRPQTCFRYLKFDRARHEVVIAMQHMSPQDVCDLEQDEALNLSVSDAGFMQDLASALAPMSVEDVRVVSHWR